MTNNHPITPPPEVVKHWWKDAQQANYSDGLPCWLNYVTTQAARWGADQELEACWSWLYNKDFRELAKELNNHRRPKPPSLKEQAKFAAAVLRSPDETCSIAELQQHWHTICNALEALDD